MVFLITGASHTGKTVLAQKILEKYKYPYLSIDHLKMGLIRSHKTTLTPFDDQKLIDYLWPVVRETIKTAIENEQNLIIEGCYVPAIWRSDFTSNYLDNIKFICIAMSDEYIDNHFDEIIKHRCDIEKRIDDSVSIEILKRDNRLIRTSFKNEDIYLINDDYEEKVKNIINSIRN